MKTQKITDKQAQEILDRIYEGERQADLAKEYGLSKEGIRKIFKGELYKHLKRKEGFEYKNKKGNRKNRGENHYSSKLTEADIKGIRRFYDYIGISQLKLAEIYGVSPSTINYIVHRKTWKHI